MLRRKKAAQGPFITCSATFDRISWSSSADVICLLSSNCEDSSRRLSAEEDHVKCLKAPQKGSSHEMAVQRLQT